MSEPRQLDEISEAIGELKGSVKVIEKYIHDERHGVNNLSQKIDGLAVSIGRDIAAVKAEIEVKIEAIGGRVGALEAVRMQQMGASNAMLAILKSPAIGWLVGAAITAWAILTGKVHI